MRVILLSLALLVSCGAPMGDDGEAGQPGSSGAQGPAGRDGRDAVQGGSRLRPLWIVGSDGTKVASFAFYDTERRERCYLQQVPGAPAESMERICAPWNFNAADLSRYVRFSVE